MCFRVETVGVAFPVDSNYFDQAGIFKSLSSKSGYSQSNHYPTLYGFIDSTDSWVKIEKELPVSLCFCAAIELPPKKLLVIGGKDSAKKRTCSVFMGSASHH